MNRVSERRDESESAFEIRDMRIEDAAFVVTLHVASMPEFFLTSLGPRFLGIYYERLVADGSAIAKVAVRPGGALVGATVGSTNPSGFYGRLLKSSWWRFGLAALPAILRSPSALRRVLRAIRYPTTQPVGEGVAGLYSIVVAPDAQARGIGRGMVSSFIAAARAKGSSAVYLHADAVGNDHWNDLLCRTGWTLQREFSTPEGRPMNEYWFNLEEQ